MKRKGFTLIELLAVIVVLAIIAIIAIPIITNVIDKAKVGALKDSAYGILESGELYLANNLKDGIEDTIEFTCSNGKCISGEETIDYKGQVDEGKMRIYPDSKIELCITDNKYSALKKVTEKEVKVEKGTCKYEELSYDVSALVSKDDYDKVTKELNDLKTLLEQTDATVEDLYEGKKAYSNGKIIVGTSPERLQSLALNVQGTYKVVEPVGNIYSTNLYLSFAGSTGIHSRYISFDTTSFTNLSFIIDPGTAMTDIKTFYVYVNKTNSTSGATTYTFYSNGKNRSTHNINITDLSGGYYFIIYDPYNVTWTPALNSIAIS